MVFDVKGSIPHSTSTIYWGITCTELGRIWGRQSARRSAQIARRARARPLSRAPEPSGPPLQALLLTHYNKLFGLDYFSEHNQKVVPQVPAFKLNAQDAAKKKQS